MGIKTPLVVPSFSSVEAKEIGKIHSSLTGRLGFASSISAYDIYRKELSEPDIWKTDLVILDSGNFENELLNGSDPKSWSLKMYEHVLESIHPQSRLIIVNFDTFGSITAQISDAETLFSRYPWAGDLLCKPIAKDSKKVSESRINTYTIAAQAKKLRRFDIIGFTEKELGNSLESRCQSIIDIRNSLGPDQPIHIFGCGDPLGIIAYFLCGADIFDGLGWLRYGISNGVQLYRNNYTLITRGWHSIDTDAYRLMLLMNLRSLKTLTVQMRRFVQSHSIGEFGLDAEASASLVALLGDLHVEVSP